jgi:hypothetical protein
MEKPMKMGFSFIPKDYSLIPIAEDLSEAFMISFTTCLAPF